MNKAIKKKWLKALRSGEYEQGRGRLCDTSGEVHKFCCLGVLINEVEGFGVIGRDYAVQELGYGGMPTAAFRSRVRLSNDAQWRLVSMNDRGKSFTEIADWIEANL